MDKLILVEYCNQDELTTFELFLDIEKAFNFCKEIKNVKRIDLVDVNSHYIYFEEDGTLNYEDNSGLIKQGILGNIY